MLLTVTLTAPLAWAGVFAVMVLALTTTTFVAVAPPNCTFGPRAPLWKPPPLMVTFSPPDEGPLGGVREVTVTLFTSGVTVMFNDFVSAQPAAVVTVTCRVSVPAAPAVKAMAAEPAPRLMMPLVIDQV